MNELEYRIVEEYSAPSYYDNETGELLYESSDSATQGYWVVSYDPAEKEIVEWIENFPTPDRAKDYLKDMERNKNLENWGSR